METRTPSELATVADRMPATPDAAHEPAVVTHESIAALAIAADIKAGRSPRRFLIELENGTSAWRCDPWRLLGELTDLLARLRAPAAEADRTG